MNRIALVLSLALLPVVPTVSAQVSPTRGAISTASAPFSRLAIGGGVGLMGINLQAATNVNRYINVRGTGNYFSYTVNNIKINGSNGANGVDVSGNVNFAEGGVSADLYPFPRHGFRLSPGVTFYNQNLITASGVLPAGNSITLNSQKFYSDEASPLAVNANLGLNTHKQAFSMTTGWGNMISRKGGHWSFPVEIGAIFTGVPNLGMTLSGDACLTAADAAINGLTCGPANTVVGDNLNLQVAKYKSDLNPLQVYPVVSFGVGYGFRIY